MKTLFLLLATALAPLHTFPDSRAPDGSTELRQDMTNLIVYKP